MRRLKDPAPEAPLSYLRGPARSPPPEPMHEKPRDVLNTNDLIRHNVGSEPALDDSETTSCLRNTDDYG
jgi:hypothetical protein